jgi:hypothetical protein
MNLLASLLVCCVSILPSPEAALGRGNSSIITVRHADLGELVNIIEQVYQGLSPRPLVHSLPTSRRIIIDADPKLTSEIRTLIGTLDGQVVVNNAQPRVIRIQRPQPNRRP